MKLVYNHEEAQLWYDPEHKVLKAIWFGVVGFKAFANLVTRGAQILNASDYGHIIFDRRKLNNFSPEARIWFKAEFMKKGGDGRRLIKKVRKLAAIKGSSPMGQIASTVIGKLLLIFNPNLKYKIFEDDVPAHIWVEGSSPPTEQLVPDHLKNQSTGFYAWLFKKR